MKQIYAIFFLLLFVAGTPDAFSQKWSIKQGADFPGKGREYAVSFVIGNYAYVGAGSGDSKDFWRYDPRCECWSRMADLPGEGRSGAVAFVISGKAYVGLGWNDKLQSDLNDFYEYTPVTDTWTRIPDFIGSARTFATAFSIGNAGYVGTGIDETDAPTGDFYKYENGQWTQIASVDPYTKKSSATSFVIDGYGYIFLGGGLSGAYGGSFKYNPATNSWTAEDYQTFYEVTGYVLNNTPYIYDGYRLLRYNMSNKQYYYVRDIFNTGSTEGDCFLVFDNIPYKTTGYVYDNGKYDNTLWYDGNAASVKKTEITRLNIRTVITDNDLFLDSEADGNLSLTNSVGVIVLQQAVTRDENHIDISRLNNGIYFLSLKTGTNIYTGKIIKQ
jgi:N-acetylneuraminic acid mutarotase